MIWKGSLKIFFSKSKTKTDILGHGQGITLYGSPNLDSCPFVHAQNYLSFSSLFSDSVFIYKDLTPLTRHQFSAVLSSCLKKPNLVGFQFSSHSF